MAQPGGVLTRAGHTEAGCDLARLAGFEPAAVIVEILKEDGSMARRPELEVLAKERGLKIGTIADLIRFRMQHEKTVERVAECLMPTYVITYGARAVTHANPRLNLLFLRRHITGRFSRSFAEEELLHFLL
jgi:hypothetical protein